MFRVNQIWWHQVPSTSKIGILLPITQITSWFYTQGEPSLWVSLVNHCHVLQRQSSCCVMGHVGCFDPNCTADSSSRTHHLRIYIKCNEKPVITTKVKSACRYNRAKTPLIAWLGNNATAKISFEAHPPGYCVIKFSHVRNINRRASIT